jgi:hypothetical protein
VLCAVVVSCAVVVYEKKCVVDGSEGQEEERVVDECIGLCCRHRSSMRRSFVWEDKCC